MTSETKTTERDELVGRAELAIDVAKVMAEAMQQEIDRLKSQLEHSASREAALAESLTVSQMEVRRLKAEVDNMIAELGKEQRHSAALVSVATDYLDAVSKHTSLDEERKRQPGIEVRFKEALSHTSPAASRLLKIESAAREVIETLEKKREQLREYAAGIDPTAGEMKRHALTIAEGRLLQIDQDARSLTKEKSDDRV